MIILRKMVEKKLKCTVSLYFSDKSYCLFEMVESTSGRRSCYSNVLSFLDSMTPCVPSHTLPKAYFQDKNNFCQSAGRETVDFFYLSDLWNQYYEWSAYGAGAKLQLPNEDWVVQYYVPYLSSIQLFINNDRTGYRNALQGSMSCTVIHDRGRISRRFSQEVPYGARTCSEDLYMQFFECCSPYDRPPLLNKVCQLALNYPGLTTLSSADILPHSWMSVAWYPIYHIPSGRHIKELSASFLTYHIFSSSFQDPNSREIESESLSKSTKNLSKSGIQKKTIRLPAFGMATYKMHGGIWVNSDPRDSERITNLQKSADLWLRQLGVWHHDFVYFNKHSR